MIPPGNPMVHGVPVIPPPPPRMGPRRKRTSVRVLLWPAAFALGVALGLAAYAWLAGVGHYFDYWIALLG